MPRAESPGPPESLRAMVAWARRREAHDILQEKHEKGMAMGWELGTRVFGPEAYFSDAMRSRRPPAHFWTSGASKRQAGALMGIGGGAPTYAGRYLQTVGRTAVR